AEHMKHPILEAVDIVKDGFKSAFDDLIEYGHFSFRKLGQFIIAELAKKAIFKAIDDIGDAIGSILSKKSGSSGTAGNVLGSILGSIFGGGKAEGGPLESGKWYVAGERGPEPIWGGGPGAYAMGYPKAASRGGDFHVTQNINGLGMTPEQLQPVLARNNRELMRMWQDAQSRNGQAVTRF
ncbi:MAG TPA: hypothetical protein VFS24_10095, partial [Steroidobacteraceae bacterium]|nr:hypothetical protein [Steroidobacteraceae bacterium]